MSKHIAIKDFRDMLLELNSRIWLKRDTVIAILKGMANLSTIDIIYCRECEYCRDELIEEHMPLYIYCEKWNHETDFDSFCSTGERIEE